MAGAGRDYDSLLASVGELGAWHWLVLLCLVPPALLPGMWRDRYRYPIIHLSGQIFNNTTYI